MANKVYQSLFYFDGQGIIRSELVAATARQEEQLEILLQLKKDARFADGSTLNSRDVIATVALLKDPRFEYPYLADLDFIAKIEAIDPFKLLIRLRRRFAPWKNYLTFKILNAREIKNLEPEKFRQFIPMGSGPYQLVDINEPSGFQLIKNPFWPNRSSFERIRYSVLRESRLAPLKLLSAEIDAVEIQSEDAKAYWQLKKWQKQFNLLKYNKFGFTYLVFNLKSSLIDMNLQRTFYNRLQATRFLDSFLQGTGERIFSPFLYLSPQKQPRPFPTATLPAPRRLRILTNSESLVRQQLVLFLCEEMKPFRIELEPVFVEYQTFLQYLKSGNFDLAVSAFLLDMDWNMKDILSSEGYFNYAGFSRSELDRILDEGLREMNPVKRREIYERAHAMWLESLPLIPLFNLNYFMGIAKGIKIPAAHFKLIGSCGDFFYNIQDW